MAVHVDAAGVQWRRVGECNRCGECCIDGNGTPCPVVGLLHRESDGTATCTDRNHPYYQGGCNTFPTRPEDITQGHTPSCSYSFERIG